MAESEVEIGELKQFTDEVSVAELNAQFATHHNALKALREQVSAGKRTAAELQEAIDLRARATAPAVRAVRQGTTQAFVPGGSAADLDAAFLRDDGTLRLTRSAEKAPGWDGGEVEISHEGLLDATNPVTAEHKRLVERMYRFRAAQAINGKGLDTGNVVAREWAEVVKAARSMPGEAGAQLRAMFASRESFTRAINGTSGTGGEFFGNPNMGLRRPSSLPRVVTNLIPSSQTMNKSFTVPIQTGHGLSRLVGQISDDPAANPPQSFTTSSAAVTLKDFNATAYVQNTWFRDANAGVDDPLGRVLGWLDQSEIDTLEAAILHGDTNATHQDTIATWTLNSYFASGQLDGSDSPLKAWIGLRARAADDSATASGGSFAAADLTAPAGVLNTHDRDSVILAGIVGAYAISTSTEFVTVDKFGPQAFVRAGVVGSVAGKPLYVSEFLPKEFDTSSGLYTGSNAGNILVIFNPMACRLYRMAHPDESFDVSMPHKNTRAIGRSMTALMVYEVVSGEKPVYVLYNVS